MKNHIDLEHINLLNDALFKAFMVHPNNRELVANFLSAVTGISKNDLLVATYISGEEIPKRKKTTKKQTVDLTVKVNSQLQIIVEMNQEYAKNIFYKNTLYSFAKSVEFSTKNMITYPNIILINIDNFNYFKTQLPILDFKIRDQEGHIENEMYISFHLVLENIKNNSYNVDKEIKKFIEFIKETSLYRLERKYKGDKIYMAAIRTVEDLTTNPELSGYYDLEEAHKLEVRDAKLAGIEQGFIDGNKQGKIEIAKEMLKDNKSLEEIMKYTNLAKEEILILKET